MLRSMTGFGDSQYEAEDVSFQVEIKTVNNRFLKTSIKLNESLSFAELEIERLIKKELSRGSVNYSLHFRQVGDNSGLEVNQSALQNYMKHLEQLFNLYGDKIGASIDLASLLQMPGVCQSREYSEEEHQGFLRIILEQTTKALNRLQEMRVREGQGIFEDLQGHCKVIRDNLDALTQLVGTVVENYQKRLEKRINELLGGSDLKLDQESLAKEVAIFAEKSDINEEVSRLGSHLEQFDEACKSDEQAGRRLDFLTQEMLREANTIASKANDARISQHVVEIKVAIDRLREQVQNVE